MKQPVELVRQQVAGNNIPASRLGGLRQSSARRESGGPAKSVPPSRPRPKMAPDPFLLSVRCDFLAPTKHFINRLFRQTLDTVTPRMPS